MAQYWCDDCMVWVSGDEVTAKKERVERGDPPATFFYHDRCGSQVRKADKDSAV